MLCDHFKIKPRRTEDSPVDIGPVRLRARDSSIPTVKRSEPRREMAHLSSSAMAESGAKSKSSHHRVRFSLSNGNPSKRPNGQSLSPPSENPSKKPRRQPSTLSPPSSSAQKKSKPPRDNPSPPDDDQGDPHPTSLTPINKRLHQKLTAPATDCVRKRCERKAVVHPEPKTTSLQSVARDDTSVPKDMLSEKLGVDVQPQLPGAQSESDRLEGGTTDFSSLLMKLSRVESTRDQHAAQNDSWASSLPSTSTTMSTPRLRTSSSSHDEEHDLQDLLERMCDIPVPGASFSSSVDSIVFGTSQLGELCQS